MSDGDYKFQTSVKHGPGLVAMTNIRANDPDELEAGLSALVGLSDSINSVVDALKVADQFAQVGIKTEVVSGGPPPLSAEVPTCKHGAMQARSGADWAGYFCPMPKDSPERCKPVYPNKKG